MNFTESISYAIKPQHLPKVLTIVLVAMILSVSTMVLALAFQAPLFLLLLIPVMLGYSLFVGGYKISVIRAVMDGNEQLPALQFGFNLGRGAVVFLATFVYAIPFIVLYAVFGGLLYASRDAGAAMFLTVCGGALVLVLGGIAIAMSYQVGLARFAVENRAGALFNVGKNFGIVMSNLGLTGAFFWRITLISMAFSILGTMITNVISPFFSSSLENAFQAFAYNDMQALSNIAVPLLILGALFNMISMATNLISGFGGSHLLAGFAAELGFGGAKLKHDDTTNGSMIVFVVIAFVIVLGLFACAAFTVMSVLGPEIGDIFAEVIREI